MLLITKKITPQVSHQPRRMPRIRPLFNVALTLLLVAGTVLNPHTGTAAEAPTSDPTLTVEVPPKPKITFRAVVTQYSRADSCHNIKNGKCMMASGKAVYVGAVACPNFLRLGTTIVIDDETYTCEDRYAQWLDAKRKLPTIDIFVDSMPRGRATKDVGVLES